MAIQTAVTLSLFQTLLTDFPTRTVSTHVRKRESSGSLRADADISVDDLAEEGRTLAHEGKSLPRPDLTETEPCSSQSPPPTSLPIELYAAS